MPQSDNAEFVRALQAAFRRGDIPFIAAHTAEDAEWTIYGPPSIPTSGTCRGPQGVLDFFHTLAATQDNANVTVETVIAQDDHVVVLGRYTATVKSTGKPVDSPIVHIFTVRDGKLVRFLGFGDTARMAEAFEPATRRATI